VYSHQRDENVLVGALRFKGDELEYEELGHDPLAVSGGRLC
jgi:hypothetical protein